MAYSRTRQLSAVESVWPGQALSLPHHQPVFESASFESAETDYGIKRNVVLDILESKAEKGAD
jgi:hypothetical protein